MQLGRAVRAGVMAVVVVALAMGGLALAQTGDGETTTTDVPPGAYERILDLLAPLVDDGTITDSQAEAVAEHLSDRLPATDRPRNPRLARLAELLGLPPGELHEALQSGVTLAELAAQQGIAPEEVAAALRPDIAERREQADRFDAVLDVLAVTPGEVRDAAAEGLSLADLADAQGVPTDEVVAVLVAPAAERLGDAVAEGDLSEADAAERLARVEERVADRIEEPLDAHRDGSRRDRPRDDG